MSVLQAVLLGLLQGLTEFVPVSSSGHLVLVPWLLGWQEPGLAFDVVLHGGTLLAVLAYFWRDWWQLVLAWLRGLIRWDWHDPRARLMWLLIVGTIPAVIMGYSLEPLIESLFGEPVWVCAFLLVTAAVLTLGEWRGRRTRSLGGLRWVDALLVGLAQALAVAPGLSRSGATMAAGLLLGLKRRDAARFSFLLSAPIILGAGLAPLMGWASTPRSVEQVPVLLAGFVAAAVSGCAAISGLLRYLQRRSLLLFALYCTWVGVSCLVVAGLR